MSQTHIWTFECFFMVYQSGRLSCAVPEVSRPLDVVALTQAEVEVSVGSYVCANLIEVVFDLFNY